MDFMSSQTAQNLARAFAGECQARIRYSLYANVAAKEQLQYLSRLIEEISSNEMMHAKVFLEHIARHSGGPVNNMHVNAGYPMVYGTTVVNLKAAKDAELQEATEVYPAFAQVAANEGFPEIERSFNLIAQVEQDHNRIFATIHQKLVSGTLYKSDKPVLWKCSVCGHIHMQTEAWQVCPLCSHPQGFVVIHTD